MKITFLDLQRQYDQIHKEIDVAINRVLNKQYFILGNELSLFEKNFAKYLNSKYCVGVGSGTDGLILALRSLGIGKGDEVITQANSFIATTLAITEVGAKPILVDVDEHTYQIDIEQVESKITKRTKAILPVHLYGAPCDISAIIEIAQKHHLLVIEDACQSHGAKYKGKQTGTFGDVGVFSFYPGKNLGAYGDGGAVCTDSLETYRKLLSLRNYGQSKKYFHDEIGVNSRLDEIQAAVLNVKLKYIESWNKRRNNMATAYKKHLKYVGVQKISKDSFSNYHIFIIRSKKRDIIATHLLNNGVQTLIHYPVPIHLQKCYQNLGYKRGDFPVSEKLSSEILSIPLYSELTKDEVKSISSLINDSAV